MNSHFMSSFLFFHLVNTFHMRFSECSFSLRQSFVKPSLLPRDVSHPIQCLFGQSPYDWNELVFENLELNSRENLLCILASVLQILPLRVLLSFSDSESLDSMCQGNTVCQSEILDSTFFCVRTQRQVSPRLLGNEMNLTQSSLCRSDKLVIGVHLLLSPVSAVVTTAGHEVALRLSPIPEVGSQCFPLYRRSSL